MFVGRYGTGLGLAAPIGAILFMVLVAAFVFTPHVAVAVTIPYFAFLPFLRIYGSQMLGGTKDMITLAATAAAAVIIVERRAGRRGWAADRPVLILVAFLFALYVLNIGGNLSGASGYDIAWFHGVRLFSEPLFLLVVGLALPNPVKTYRWAVRSLVAAAVVATAVGAVQQVLGVQWLIVNGYRYGSQVREIGGHLRSFGTLDEPFSYSTLLLLALATVLLRKRLRPSGYALAGLFSLGLVLSFVRTAALILLALVGIAIAQRGQTRLAVFVVLIAVSGSALLFALTTGATSTRSVRITQNEYLTLNGRTGLWSSALGPAPSAWVLGRGVGVVGTASQRARESLTGATSTKHAAGGTVVDSAFPEVTADIGFVGLAILLALFGRLIVLAWRAAGRGLSSGWMALGILAIVLLDAMTRESLTGFPTAYIAMLLLGLAAATWTADDPRSDPPPRTA
jgi:O-antigen ligase